jgi:hypothetical protein
VKNNKNFWSYLAQFFLQWEMFQTKFVEKIKTHFVFSNFFENRAFYEIIWKNVCKEWQDTDDNMAHARCILETEDVKHALTICNTYCFSTATVVTRTRLSVTLCVHCVFVYFSFFNFLPLLLPFFFPLIPPLFFDSFLTFQDSFHEEIKWSCTVNSQRYHSVLPLVLYRR